LEGTEPVETRANYVLVASFVLAILGAAALGAILLLNLTPFPDTRAYYDIHFRGSVVGLKVGAPVSLSGVPIGNVRKVQIDPGDPTVVDVTVEVQKGAAIRTDSIASLDISLVFGDVSISITGGSERAPLLIASSSQPFPIIASTASQLTATGIEQLITRTIEVSDTLIVMLDEKGRQAISQHLEDAEHTTALVMGTTERFDRFIDDAGVMVHDAHDQATALTTKLDDLSRTLQSVQAQLGDAGEFVKNMNQGVRNFDSVLQANRPELVDLTRNTLTEFHGTISQLRVTIRNVARYIEDFMRDPQGLFGKPRAGYKPK
jgi:phospholipid/cholesterol/gamma-HCH transport system substrate-binding protein